MLLRVLVTIGGVADHDADYDQEDEEVEDENACDGAEESSVEDNIVTYETAAENEGENRQLVIDEEGGIK